MKKQQKKSDKKNANKENKKASVRKRTRGPRVINNMEVGSEAWLSQ